jgi:hypothetical protein
LRGSMEVSVESIDMLVVVCGMLVELELRLPSCCRAGSSDSARCAEKGGNGYNHPLTEQKQGPLK